MARHYHCQGCSCCSHNSKLFESDHEGVHRLMHGQEDIYNKSNRRGILKPPIGRKYGDYQVDDLHDTLDDANYTMSENEKLLSDYRTTNLKRSMELDELCSELEKSKDQLSSRCSSPQQVVHFHTSTTPATRDEDSAHERQRLRSELEQEKWSRQRAEIERSQLKELLDTSFKGQSCSASSSCDRFTSELTEHLRNLQNVLQQSHVKTSQHNADITTRLKEIEDKLHESASNDKASQRLADELRRIKDDLSKRDESERRSELERELKSLESELSSERKLLNTSLQQSEKLTSKVDELGHRVDQVQREKNRALSCLEVTTHQLNKSVGEQRELERQLHDLKQQLIQSEKEKTGWEEKCATLVQDCKHQMAKLEHSKDMEGKLLNCKAEKLAIEEQCEKVRQQLSERTVGESKLKEQCSKLQLRLSQSTKNEEELKQKLRTIEEECNERKTEVYQLKIDMKSVNTDNESLQNQVQLFERELRDSERSCDQLVIELKEVSAQLESREDDKRKLMEKLDLRREQVQTLIAEKKQIEVELSNVKSRLVESQEATVTNQNQAFLTAKKYKQKCRQLEQDNLKLNQDREQLVLQMEEMLRSHQECTAQLKNRESLLSFLQQENDELKEKIKELESHQVQREKEIEQCNKRLIELRRNLVTRKTEFEKIETKLKESSSDIDVLSSENVMLKEELSQARDEYRQTKEKLSLQFCQSEETSRSQIQVLQNEIKSCKEENSQLKDKLSKCSYMCLALKRELSQVKQDYEHKESEISQLEESLEHEHLKSSTRESNLSSELDSLKATHVQELESVKKGHRQTVSKLQQTISKMQIQLADEQSTVKAMKRHQLQFFNEHQKMMQDDLTKSLDDTEKLKSKYIEAKRIYVEKTAALKAEISETYKEEIECLRQQLAKSQSLLHQQTADYEDVLRETAVETDNLVTIIGKRVHNIPIFPADVDQECSAKRWTAELMAKFQWLQKEVNEVISLEVKLKRKLKELKLKDQKYTQMNCHYNEQSSNRELDY